MNVYGLELKDVKNIIFINFTRCVARVQVEDDIKQIKFETKKLNGNKICFTITEGHQYCQI